MPAPDPAELYLELLKRCLTREVFEDASRVLTGAPSGPLDRVLARVWPSRAGRAAHRVERRHHDADLRREGRDWPAEAETMIGRLRLDDLHRCVRDVLREGVPGDLIETGVWRGGATIFLRGALEAYGDTSRAVWVADSFAGIPEPDPTQASDVADRLWQWRELAIPVEDVRHNFERYGLLDDRVRFLVGLFADTLPEAPIEQLALMRLDGDLYESTMDALEALYHRLSPGGYVVIDDYGAVEGCRAATEDFRSREGITEPLEAIDWSGVRWRRSR